jgi:toxin YoeB
MEKYYLEYSPESLDDISKLRKTGDKLIIKKLNSLLDELHYDPRTGTGHPERLKGYPERERWSRRITEKHRLVYDIKDEVVTVLVVSAYGHYADK